MRFDTPTETTLAVTQPLAVHASGDLRAEVPYSDTLPLNLELDKPVRVHAQTSVNLVADLVMSLQVPVVFDAQLSAATDFSFAHVKTYRGLPLDATIPVAMTIPVNMVVPLSVRADIAFAGDIDMEMSHIAQAPVSMSIPIALGVDHAMDVPILAPFASTLDSGGQIFFVEVVQGTPRWRIQDTFIRAR